MTATAPAGVAPAGGGVAAAAARARRSRPVQRSAWVLLAVVVATALAVGWHRPTLPPRAARIAAIEADVKCPSCEDLSVADSTAPTAVAVREAITARVDAGQSTAAVEDYLVGRYGTAILLRPPTSGGAGLVWALPAVAAAVAVAGMGVVFWRRRRPPAVVVPDEDDELVRRALADTGRADAPGEPG